MQRYVPSAFPRRDLKFINSIGCLKMTMNETKSCDTFAAFQTMHIMKSCKCWASSWGPKDTNCDINWNVPGVVREKKIWV
jgi:hypothetical protein